MKTLIISTLLYLIYMGIAIYIYEKELHNEYIFIANSLLPTFLYIVFLISSYAHWSFENVLKFISALFMLIPIGIYFLFNQIESACDFDSKNNMTLSDVILIFLSTIVLGLVFHVRNWHKFSYIDGLVLLAVAGILYFMYWYANKHSKKALTFIYTLMQICVLVYLFRLYYFIKYRNHHELLSNTKSSSNTKNKTLNHYILKKKRRENRLKKYKNI